MRGKERVIKKRHLFIYLDFFFDAVTIKEYKSELGNVKMGSV